VRGTGLCFAHLRNIERDGVTSDRSIEFFEQQFAQQLREHRFELNPFETLSLPHLHGRVLDFGCGLGNLTIAAARRGCSVVALDASGAAIDHLRRVASTEGLAIEARQVDLRHHAIQEDYDTIVSIGLLMFFDCPTAFDTLANIQAHVQPGGTAIINLLVEGTTFLDMFDVESHCLFARDELARRFAHWDVLAAEHGDYPAPRGSMKSFETLIARKPDSTCVATARAIV
jgi:tellurite methyltransferase